jgi:AcrR family transcriptional regulator
MTDMSAVPAGYHALQKNSTREAILDAVERCLSTGGLDQITFSQVAQEAGVSERTVYRHFETKELMLEAFWRRLQQTLGIERSTRSWKDYLDTRPEAFEQMENRERLIRAVMQSAQAHDARLRINAARQAGIRRVVTDGVGKLPEPAFTELCALVHLLGSAPAWAALRDYWGIDGARAGRVVARAIAALASAATRSGGPA